MRMLSKSILTVLAFSLCLGGTIPTLAETLPPLKDGKAPETFKNLGGLFVHVGSDDIAQTASMVKKGNFLIHCLYTKRNAFDKAQTQIATAGLGGKVSASMFDGTVLPFIDNVVNMLVVEDGFAISRAEIKRVLTPRGTARYYEAGNRRELVKEVRDTIDEFTHNLYDGTNTGVSKDKEVGPPAHLQWTGKPDWMRSHDISASMQGMVTAGGRLFYIHDEATRSFISFAPDWQLVCRDAFNGKILWKRPLDQGMTPYLKGGKITTASLPHRIVAHADAIYVTLGMHQPIKAIDARTGEDLWTAPQTESTVEMILHNGVLYCVVNTAPKRKLKHLQDLMARPSYMTSSAVADRRKILALDARNGSTIWEKVPDSGKVLHLSLAVSDKGVFYHDAKESLVCLSNADGRIRWRTKGVPYYKDLRRYSGANMVLYKNVVLYACGSASVDRKIRATTKNMIRAFDVDTGEFLWTAEQPQQGLFTTPDLLVADGLVWVASIDKGSDDGKYRGLHPRTGKVIRDFPTDSGFDGFAHHRCHRNRGTENYLILGRSGMDLFDVKTGKWDHNYWVRGQCRLGMIHGNGMIYATPSACTCYMLAKIRGINGLVAPTKSRAVPKVIPDAGRLVKGLDYGHKGPQVSAEDWPTFRGNAARHGNTQAKLAESYAKAWSTSIGGKLTQAVVADGTVLVAAPDKYAVYALNETDGSTKWRFQAGSAVNSPPTVWEGKVLFGCMDGWVYCLNLQTATLVWKYRAAPVDRRLIAHESLQSVWPIDGAVLVIPDPDTGKGRVYCVAGRSMFLDGGLRSLVLDVDTGTKLHETVMNEIDPATGQDVQDAHSQSPDGWKWIPPDFPSMLRDVLSYDGRSIYMGIQPFKLDGTRKGGLRKPDRNAYEHTKRKPASKRTETAGDHLYSSTGFLDDGEMHRGFWQWGSDSFGQCWQNQIANTVRPAGNIMVADGDNVYAWGRQFYTEGTQPTYHLSSTRKVPDVISFKEKFAGRKIARQAIYDYTGSVVHNWSHKYDLYARAMVVGPNVDANRPKLLFAVGTPEVIDEYDAINLIYEQQEEFRLGRIRLKERAVAGEFGAKMMVVSTEDGTVISETRLDHPAVFDGMSAANGKIFVSDIKGNVVCLKPSKVKGFVDFDLPVIDESSSVK